MTFRKLASIVFTCAVLHNVTTPRPGTERRTSGRIPPHPIVGSDPVPRSLSRRRLLGTASAGAAAITLSPMLSGCTSAPPKTVDQLVGTDPLGPLYTETVNLIGVYDQALAARTDLAAVLGQLREENRRHAIALAGLMGALNPPIPAGSITGGSSTGSSGAASTPEINQSPTNGSEVPGSAGPASAGPTSPGAASTGPSSPAAASTGPPSIATLSNAEKTAQANAAAACLAATGSRVPVLASIAACRSTHVAALGALR